MIKVLGHGRLQYDYGRSLRQCVVPRGITVISIEEPNRILAYPIAQKYFNYFAENKELFTNEYAVEGLKNIRVRVTSDECYSIKINGEGDRVFDLALSLANEPQDNRKVEFVIGYHHVETLLSNYDDEIKKVGFTKKVPLSGVEEFIVSNIGTVNSTSQLLSAVSNIRNIANYDGMIYLFTMSCMPQFCPYSISMEDFYLYSSLLKSLINSQDEDSLFGYTDNLLQLSKLDRDTVSRISSITNLYYNKEIKVDDNMKAFFYIGRKSMKTIVSGLYVADQGIDVKLSKFIISNSPNQQGMKGIIDKYNAEMTVMTLFPYKSYLFYYPGTFLRLHRYLKQLYIDKRGYNNIVSIAPVDRKEYTISLEKLGYKSILFDGKQYIFKLNDTAMAMYVLSV